MESARARRRTTGAADACVAVARQCGAAAGHYRSLRAVRADLQGGRFLLPREDLAAAGVTLADLVHRPQSPGARQLMRAQHLRIESACTPALRTLGTPDRRSLAGPLTYLAIMRATLAEIADDDYALLERRVSLTPVRKLWIAWRHRRGRGT